ncbi:MAG TPA: VWA domain-containing protein, partial [Casimicrobiaceae bacterium]|nr:VWA domain-containing protein [Casimicrobiaceae bacterium]
ALAALETAERVGVFDRDVLRWSLRALLCARCDEWQRFDRLFDAYFLPPNRRRSWDASVSERGRDSRSAGGTPEEAGDAATLRSAGDVGDDDAARDDRQAASREESRATAEFRALDENGDLVDIAALMRRLARRLKRIAVRREVRARRGRRLDLPGTIRRSVESGGTPVRFAWKNRRRIRPRLVLLLDVSRSMSPYSVFFLRLARALIAELSDVHCFVFHTRIVSVSDALADTDPRRAQDRLHVLSEGWAGGTRIGESLETFNRVHAPRLVHSRTAVIVVSDGYDSGEPEVLAGALSAIARRARRVVWLNPLAGSPGFTPTSRGMRAALPYLDLFASGADLASVERALPEIVASLS